ncbi:MAG: alpha/beta fold hydrolase [Actinobacteria bacterium]|nr:MAG: alpha/beta fold hydrolase [Actinomycetota bacterium]
MAFATDGGVSLYYEETGSGTPLLFSHEFAGDHRSWEPQVRELGRRYRCITYSARGYPPSDVPDAPEAYSQERAVADAVAVLDHLGIERAHVVGLSMGGFCALHLGLSRPERALSLVVAGCGYGSQPERRESFRSESEANALAFETDFEKAAAAYALGPARVQFQNKDPRGFAEFAARLAEHSAKGSALTLRGVQMRRPSLYDLRERLAAMRLPVLIVTGDEDEGSLEPGLMLKRTIPSSALAVLPRTGHACNLEEPALFNRLVQDFLSIVEAGRWAPRDPRSISESLTGAPVRAQG